jgi:hypothetical protein
VIFTRHRYLSTRYTCQLKLHIFGYFDYITVLCPLDCGTIIVLQLQASLITFDLDRYTYILKSLPKASLQGYRTSLPPTVDNGMGANLKKYSKHIEKSYKIINLKKKKKSKLQKITLLITKLLFYTTHHLLRQFTLPISTT